MVKLVLIAWLVAQASTSYSCSTTPSGPFPVKQIEIKVGQSRGANGVDVTFETVLSDSRCPIDVTCVHAGDAIGRFRLRTKASQQTVELAVADAARHVAKIDDAFVEFSGLTPVPRSTTTTNPASYVATITIRK